MLETVKKRSSDIGEKVEYPPYPYIPGRGPRYPDHYFSLEHIKATVTPDIEPSELGKTQAFIAGRAYYEAGYYWECYQVLDPVWMHTKDPSPERDIVLAYIQLANARLKLRSDRPHAAWRLCDMVEAHLSRCPDDRAVLGLRVADLLNETQATRLLAKERM